MWRVRSSSFFWGGVLVILGVLWLLSNTDVLNHVNWNFVWPVLLIALGVGLIVARVGPGGSVAGVDSSEPRGDVAKGMLDIAFGAGRVEVRSAALGDQLYRAHVDHAGSTPGISFDRTTGKLRISQRPDWIMGAGRAHLEVQLSDAVPWAVGCSTGAIRGEFALASAALTSFECRTGASRITLDLGAPKGVVPISVAGGALTIDLTRPASAPIKVNASGAAVTLHADGSRQDGVGQREWRSTGFDGAAERYEVTVSGAALNVTVSGR